MLCSCDRIDGNNAPFWGIPATSPRRETRFIPVPILGDCPAMFEDGVYPMKNISCEEVVCTKISIHFLSGYLQTLYTYIHTYTHTHIYHTISNCQSRILKPTAAPLLKQHVNTHDQMGYVIADSHYQI